ncbi:hypothetical protein ACFVS2_21675 [Brevibacillus sp. NPDC058079]|uniref:ADP-ribosyltransferase-containing protein n=1 Tax=Brevibacillus sp. NPDC058079 TaxID=3346330 RepID=UPI0036ECBCCF
MVYHGSRELFEVFDYSKIGTNGTMEGKGFYFTDSVGVASGYGGDGYLYTVEFHSKKPLSSEKKTITKEGLKKYLLALHEATDYLFYWGDVACEGLEKVLNKAVSGEYDHSANDVDIISGIANASGNMEASLSLVYQVLGYDSIVLDADWGNGQKLYIALTNDIIQIIEVKELKRS